MHPTIVGEINMKKIHLSDPNVDDKSICGMGFVTLTSKQDEVTCKLCKKIMKLYGMV